MLVSASFLDFFLFSLFNSGALKAANARIASLEAELEASRTAFDAVTAAKVNAEKSTKSALAKAKKTEKGLANANKEHLQREQAVAERLNQMSAAAGGTSYTFFHFVGFLALLCFADVFLFCCFVVSLVLQNIVKCLRRLCNLTKILSWPRSACWKLTGYLSGKSSSWLTAYLRGFLSGCGPIRRPMYQT
jgi:hypothetical protein